MAGFGSIFEGALDAEVFLFRSFNSVRQWLCRDGWSGRIWAGILCWLFVMIFMQGFCDDFHYGNCQADQKTAHAIHCSLRASLAFLALLRALACPSLRCCCALSLVLLLDHLFATAFLGWNGVICAGVILSVMGAAVFFNVLGAPNPWPVC